MNNLKIKLYLLISFSCFSLVGQGQDAEVVDTLTGKLNFLEFAFDRTFPINTFKTNLDRNLSGASMTFVTQLKKERLDYLGVALEYAHIGNVTVDFPEQTVVTGSNILAFKALFRHYPNFYFWRIEPFVEFSLGPQFFYTQSTTSFFDAEGGSDVDIDEFDTSIGYGIGAGFSFHIYQQVFMVSQISYNGGTSVTYLVDRSDDQPFPLDNFRPETTQANFLRWKIGISISL